MKVELFKAQIKTPDDRNQNNNISKEAFNNACRSWISRVNSLRNVMSVKEQEKHMFDVSSCHTIDEFLGDNVKSKLYDKEGRIISRKVHTKRRVSESKIMELLWHKKKGGRYMLGGLERSISNIMASFQKTFAVVDELLIIFLVNMPFFHNNHNNLGDREKRLDVKKSYEYIKKKKKPPF
ncbi:hypothetical protein C2G38_2043069 [Gigaspora rosea]|uniref:Uncharacterized protein n=1 Tax=Gigaspora rosea TaxID=44941 RepID=A0A397UUS7_9GLOM|nr:hypothetical protein C2G38_2043069 [Gigaspora rosea]